MERSWDGAGVKRKHAASHRSRACLTYFLKASLTFSPWPSPEVQLERLIAGFEAAAADESRPEEERSRAKQVGLWLTGALSQIAIGALGGAGGNLMTGD